MKLKSRRALVAAILCILGCIAAAVLILELRSREGVPAFATLRLEFRDEQDIGFLRQRIMALKGLDGRPKYQDVELQTIPEPTQDKGLLLGSRSRTFQARLYPGDPDRSARFSSDIRDLLESESPLRSIQVIGPVRE